MMSTRGVRILVLGLIVVLAFGLVGSVMADEVSPDGSPEGPEIVGDPAQFPDPPPDNDAELSAAEGDIVLAQPPYTMNYQGYLTDGDGNPLNGTHNFAVSLWDAETDGNKEWGAESHPNIPVDRGLFNLVLGSAEALTPDVFDEALFLKIKVDGVALPRQPLRPSAYAFGLVPGAEVEGVSESTWGLRVSNTSTNPDSYGLYARGRKYGIFAQEVGGGDVGIYTNDFVQALGYRSGADSWYYTAGMEGDFFTGTANLQKNNQKTGEARLSTTGGVSTLAVYYIPLHIPAVLYGQPVQVEQLRVMYKTSNSNTYIDETELRKQINNGAATTQLIDSDTNRTSTSWTNYTLTPADADDATLSSSNGILIARLQVRLETGETLYIAGVGVRLGHVDQ